MGQATEHYERREAELGNDVLRQVERQVMLRIIDQRWREHLEEMDYLQGGINLRAMGQKDPLTEWQREGFEMFGAMMTGIAQDFVKYVMNVQVVQNQVPAVAGDAPAVQNMQTSSSDDADIGGFDQAAAAAVAEGELPPDAVPAQAAPVQAADRGQGRLRQDAAQRALPVRVGQEVQAVPRRCLTHDSDPCATSPPTSATSAAASTRPSRYLSIADNRERFVDARSRDLRSRALGRPGPRQEAQHRVRQHPRRPRRVRLAHRAARRRRGAPRTGPRRRRRVAGTRHRGSDRLPISATLDQLELRSLFTGEHDDSDCIVQINAKDGGVDAQDFSEMLLRMYERWCERRGFTISLNYVSEGAEAGIMSAEVTIAGRYAYGLMTAERGTHRLVRISPFDNQGRRQTSFAAVQVWPLLEDVELDIDESDIRMEVFRASGAGGQHINKTSSAVRLIHEPTGLVASSQEERSQLQNRERAMGRLTAMIAAKAEEDRAAELDSIAGKQAQVGWGSQIRSYVLQPYQMVKDLRTEIETSDVSGVLDGDIDEFVEGFLRMRRAQIGE